MTIEKLKSGSYRIRTMENGKLYLATVDYKPTKKQALLIIKERIEKPQTIYDSITLYDAIDRYIQNKDAILSPATIRGYKSIQKNLPKNFTSLTLCEINQEEVQRAINIYATNHAPKTVRNAHGLVYAILDTFMPNMDIHTTLPQKRSKKAYMPSSDEVSKLLTYAKGSEYYVALCLACLSCRRSEFAAATINDIHYDKKGNAFLTINKALVPNEHNKYVIKNFPKTSASLRDIPLTKELHDVIIEQGYIYRYSINAVDKYLRTNLPKLGINTFSVHALRHFYASYMVHMGFDSANIKAGGGWEMNSKIMEEIYLEEMEADKTRLKMSKKMAKLF